MFNELLWIGLLLFSFLMIVVSYKFFGVTGLIAWVAMSTILANIQVAITIELFGTVATLGNIIYGATYLCTDIMSEKYGRKKAQQGVFIGFFTLLVSTAIMQICIQFIPHASDTMMPVVSSMFALFPRIAFASMTAYLISQLHDTYAYEMWRKKFPNHLWLRNNGSTIVSQLIDTVIFTLIAFVGVFPVDILWEIGISAYVLKVIVSISDTPFVYLATRIKPNQIKKAS